MSDVCASFTKSRAGRSLAAPDIRSGIATRFRPERHLVDAGCIEADGPVAGNRDHGTTLIGPPPDEDQRQLRTEGAFALEQFTLDRGRQTATCAADRTSESRIADGIEARRPAQLRASAFVRLMAAPA